MYTNVNVFVHIFNTGDNSHKKLDNARTSNETDGRNKNEGVLMACSNSTEPTLSETATSSRLAHHSGKMRSVRRQVLAFILPALVYDMGWLAVMISWHLWHIFPEKYYMSVAMIFGALICG